MSANKEQQEAIDHKSNLMIIAGPGSGKTFTMIQKISKLVKDGIRPEEILVLTFTNEAAGELRARLTKNKISGVKAGTFHSFCFEELRKVRKDAKIASEKDLNFIYKSLEIKDSEKSYIHSKRCGAAYNFDAKKDFVLKQYVEELRNRSLIDFNDILIEFIKDDRIIIDKKVVIVDEFQDTSKLQYKALKKITSNSTIVNAVGDDSQSIYAFNGANMKNMKEFVDDYKADVIFLETNYRSTTDICEAANFLISNSKETIFRKKIKSFSEKKNPIFSLTGGMTEAARKATDMVSHGSVAVICRSNAVADYIRKEIPSSLLSRKFMYNQKDVLRSVFALFDGDFSKFCDNLNNIDFYGKSPDDLGGFINSNKIPENLKQKISESLSTDPVLAYEKIFGESVNLIFRSWYYRDELDKSKKSHCEVFDEVFAISEAIHKNNEKKTISVITAHGSKGLEFKTVIIPEFNEGFWPAGKLDWKNIEEERRIFYVAITRAEENLFIFKNPRKPDSFFDKEFKI